MPPPHHLRRLDFGQAVSMITGTAQGDFHDVCRHPGDSMPRRSMFDADLRPSSLLKRASFALLFVAVAGQTLHSKDASLTAIELFDGPNGAAFVQVTGLLINGKAEVRSCGGATKISKSSYGKLAKIPLTSSVTSLERDAKGTMTLTRGTASECVVPSNLKFDKDESLTPAQLADRAVLQGQVASSSPAGRFPAGQHSGRVSNIRSDPRALLTR